MWCWWSLSLQSLGFQSCSLYWWGLFCFLSSLEINFLSETIWELDPDSVKTGGWQKEKIENELTLVSWVLSWVYGLRCGYRNQNLCFGWLALGLWNLLWQCDSFLVNMVVDTVLALDLAETLSLVMCISRWSKSVSVLIYSQFQECLIEFFK